MELPLRVLVLADVVLPLPLAETYTYRLPERLAERVAVGSRIIVPFGSKKIYSAVVVKVYRATDVDDSHPARLFPYTLKEAVDLLDEAPILLPDQLWLWHWIADYYLCTLGEVYKASMPGGMKLESESVVEFNPDYDAEVPLGRAEQHLLDLMEHLRRQKVAELQKALADGRLQPEDGKSSKGRFPNVLSVIKSLLDKGALVMHEELQRNYRPKTVNCVRLSEAYFDEARLNQRFDGLRRAEKQRNLLQRYLELSKARAALTLKNPSLLVEVEKQTLMEGHSEAALKGLKERGVVEVYEKEVSRLERSGNGASLIGKVRSGVTLSPTQQRAHDEIRAALAERDICLLHGVTGSVKTEI